jgi:CDGSH-type Zn-finger protein
MSEDVKVELMKNGPIILTGVDYVQKPDGSKLKLGNHIAYLCRCGHSKNKPHCDGSHKKIGFNDEE